MDDPTRIQINRPYELADPTRQIHPVTLPGGRQRPRRPKTDRRQARLELYREIRDVAWMWFAVVCTLTITVAFGITVAMVADRLTWK